MRPGFGIFILPVVHSDSSNAAQEQLRLAVDDTLLAERLDFDAVWVAEHHGTRYGGACPSALTLLAYCAGRTSRIGLGSAVSILPLHDPIVLAEQALLLDHLAEGRLQLGLGAGFLGVDFDTVGISMELRHERFVRGLAVLRHAIGGSDNPSDSTTLARTLHLTPEPFRERIPLWGAAATSREGIGAFADAGVGLMMNPYTRSHDEVAAAVSFYHERAGRASERFEPRVLIHEHLFVSATAADAASVPRPYLMKYLQALRASSGEGLANVTTHAAGPQQYEELFPEHVAFGTPQQIRDRIQEWLQIGVTDFAFSFRFGGMPPEVAHASAALFASDVIPYFRDPSGQ